MNTRSLVISLIVAVGGASAIPAFGADEIYVFTGPPRETAEQGKEVYAPIAAFLSEITGKRIVYRHPGNWLIYQNDMRTGAYDLVYDGPHFVSWRMKQLKHEPLATLAHKLSFVIAVRNSYTKINTVSDLCGYRVCGFGPPNFATMTMYSLFSNPARQPVLVEVKSLKQAHEGVLDGRCVGAVMRAEAFAKMHKDRPDAKVIHRTDPVPNQTFTAGPRFTAQDKAAMADALVSPEAGVRMVKFLARFNNGAPLVKAVAQDYVGLSDVLKDTWGFDCGEESSK